MKIIITEEQKKKLFIPRRLNKDDSRYTEHNNSQPIKNINGKDIRINQYDHEGRKQGYWESYYMNGKLWYKGSYKNDKRDGYWEYYYSNGQLDYKGSYVNDERDGYWESYWRNGQLDYKGSYVNGKMEGYWEEYYSNGQLWFKGSYVNGKFIKDLNESEENPIFYIKEDMGLIVEGNVQEYLNKILDRVKDLPYQTKKRYLTIAISTLLGYTSYPVIQTIINRSNDIESKEIVKVIKPKKENPNFKDGTTLRLSNKGFEHIVNEEKPRLVAYNLDDGKITVSYGHAEPIGTTNLKVGQKITKEQAKIYLKQDLKYAADGVRRMFADFKKEGKNYKVTQDMFDALVSLAYNIGVTGLRKTKMVNYLKDGEYKTAGEVIKKTKINNKKFPGLEIRRKKESNMFLSYLLDPDHINV